MKTQVAAFALLLMVGAAPAALAQDQNHDHDRGREQGHPGGGPQGGERHGPAQAVQHAAPPQQARPPGPPAGASRAFGGGERHGPPPGGGERPNFTPGARPPGFQSGQRPQTFQPVAPARGGEPRGRPGVERGRPGPEQGRTPAAEGGRANFDHGRPGVVRGRPGVSGEHARPQGAGSWNHRPPPAANRPRPPSGNHPRWTPGSYPRAFRAHRRFHGRPYIRPPGFFAHTWLYGEFLPSAWFGPQYLLTDWWDFGLPWPPEGYDWVRVGGDALLVDDYTGEIVQVVRDLFW